MEVQVVVMEVVAVATEALWGGGVAADLNIWKKNIKLPQAKDFKEFKDEIQWVRHKEDTEGSNGPLGYVSPVHTRWDQFTLNIFAVAPNRLSFGDVSFFWNIGLGEP